MTQGDQNEFQHQIDQFRADHARIIEQVSAVIVGQERIIEQVLTCLLCQGHALLEGVPGLGKTLLVRTLADALSLEFSRIQFTPDLMPADIIGATIVMADQTGMKGFSFQKGPIFANLVLADEINRATPKTQSAVLEAMQERTVSVGRTIHPLPEPFMVLATQNPLEMEGTYPLPEAQLDRFMFKINVLSPDESQLVAILDRTAGAAPPAASKVLDGPRIRQMQSLVRQVVAAEHVKRYAARLTLATHPVAGADEQVCKYVRYGASPRGAQAMLLGAKAAALVAGRANASLDDVAAAAPAALRHRLILSFAGQAEGIDADGLLDRLVKRVARE